MHGIHGGDLDGVLAATRRALGRSASARRRPVQVRRLLRRPGARPRRARRRWWRRGRPPASWRRCPPPCCARGRSWPRCRTRSTGWAVRTLGELAALPSRAVAERFGHPGLLALDLARGRDTPLEPRRPARAGVRAHRAARGGLRAAARARARAARGARARPPRAARALAAGGGGVGAVRGRRHLARGGHASPRQRRPGPDPPDPGPQAGRRCRRRRTRWRSRSRPSARRPRTRAGCWRRRAPRARARLDEAVRQARQAAGHDAALRVLDVDPDSRLPERRAVLAPFVDGEPERRGGGEQPERGGPRRLAPPRPARVRARGERRPGGVRPARPVESVREDWVVEDRWWTGRPLRRRYFELVLADGRNVTVLRDAGGGEVVRAARLERSSRPRPRRPMPDPWPSTSMPLLTHALRLGASDLHVKVPSVPRVRIAGQLRELRRLWTAHAGGCGGGDALAS